MCDRNEQITTNDHLHVVFSYSYVSVCGNVLFVLVGIALPFTKSVKSDVFGNKKTHTESQCSFSTTYELVEG